MQKVIITIIALTMLLTTRSVFASIFVDYDEGTAASGDEAFVLRDLDFVDVERVEAGSGKKINIIAKTLNWIIKDRPTPLTGVDLFTVTTSAGQYPFIFKANGDLALKNWTLTTNNATNTTPSLTFRNTQALSSGFSDLTFDSASGSKLALRVPVTTSDQPELKFTSSTGGTSKIQFVHNGDIHQIQSPDIISISNTELVLKEVSLSANKIQINNSAKLTANDGNVLLNDLEVATSLQFANGCFTTTSSNVYFKNVNCTNDISVRSANAFTNTPTTSNTTYAINAAYTLTYKSISTSETNPVFQIAFLDDFCTNNTDCSDIWKYSRLANHAPY